MMNPFAFQTRAIHSVIAMAIGSMMPVTSQAQENVAGSGLKISGFASLVAGKILSGTGTGKLNASNFDCPCQVGDFGNAGVYQSGGFSMKQESRAGVQLNYSATPQLDFVGQVVTRGTVPKPNVQWAYAGYKFGDGWEIQAGRKRIPLFYYSDYQDVGTAYPWVSVPPEYYGWDVVNYNGASLRYTTSLGNFNLTGSVFAGREKVNESGFQKIFTTDRSDATWSKLRGAELEITNGALTTRLVYLKADTRVHSQVTDGAVVTHLSSFGIAAQLDYGKWFAVAEFAEQDNNFYRQNLVVKAPGGAIGAGMRFGAWTPFITYSKFREVPTDRNVYPSTLMQRRSATLRYDINSKSDIKLQYDRYTDSAKNYGGNAKVLRISYDLVF